MELKNKATIYAILPCYNEEKNIAELARLWNAEREKLLTQGFSLVIVPIDDKSLDGTKQILKELSSRYDNVTPLFHKKNGGLGEAVTTGFRHFLRVGGQNDFACVMDGDNTQKPEYIHRLLAAADRADEPPDCVIASRYQKTAVAHGIPPFRNFLSLGARLYYTLLLRVPHVRDYTCGYRLYRYSALKKAFEAYGDDFITEKGFTCMMEILYKLYLMGAKFAEVPFNLRYDHKQGESKMRILKTARHSLFKTLRLSLGGGHPKKR